MGLARVVASVETKHVLDGGTTTTPAQTRWVQNAFVITTKSATSRSQWEDLLVCTLSGSDVLHMYVASAVLDVAGMGSALLVYRKVQPPSTP